MNTTRGHISNANRWAGSITALATAVLLIVSIRWRMRYESPHVSVGLSAGSVTLLFLRPAEWSSKPPPFDGDGFSFDRSDLTLRWWFDFATIPRTAAPFGTPGLLQFIGIPLWAPIALVALPTALAWRRHRRMPPHACPNCRYTLTGLRPNSPCPECGTPRDA